jgi:hypothetical protein
MQCSRHDITEQNTHFGVKQQSLTNYNCKSRQSHVSIYTHLLCEIKSEIKLLQFLLLLNC